MGFWMNGASELKGLVFMRVNYAVNEERGGGEGSRVTTLIRWKGWWFLDCIVCYGVYTYIHRYAIELH